MMQFVLCQNKVVYLAHGFPDLLIDYLIFLPLTLLMDTLETCIVGIGGGGKLPTPKDLRVGKSYKAPR